MTTPRYSSVLGLACVLSVLFLWVEPVHAMGKGPGPASIRNVIIMIGDGMGPEQVELARKFAPNEELAMDRLDGDPNFMTTDDVDGDVTDSAAAGTALATGVKTFGGAVSVDVDGNPLETALERAEAHGKTSGLLTSVMITCATPAVWASHTDSRSNLAEISVQQASAGVEVLMGGGRIT